MIGATVTHIRSLDTELYIQLLENLVYFLTQQQNIYECKTDASNDGHIVLLTRDKIVYIISIVLALFYGQTLNIIKRTQGQGINISIPMSKPV